MNRETLEDLLNFPNTFHHIFSQDSRAKPDFGYTIEEKKEERRRMSKRGTKWAVAKKFHPPNH